MLRLFKYNLSHNQKGALNSLLIPFILVVLILFALGGFGYWAYMSRQDYKDNTDQKVATAVTVAKQQQSTTDAATYAQAAKDPLRIYIGPSAYGSLNILYPKTWSAYIAVAPDAGDSTPIDAYFDPNVVPDIADPASIYDLRVQVTQTPYSQILANYNSQAQQSQVTIAPYSLPKVPSVVGVRVDGTIESNIQGSMVILPLRATTLEIWTESEADESDFNNNILPNFSFSP